MTNWPTHCKTPVKARASRRTTLRKATITTTALPLALAGFRQEDLEIQLEGTRLSVKGTPEQPKEEKKWLHQGLMNQPFSLSFTLAENMEVSGATFVNGLLHIDLIRNEPEPIAAQRIAISERPALNS